MPPLINAFAGTRMAIGVLSWLAPSLAARVFGLEPEGRQPIVTQLFGAREFALGLATATSSGAARRHVLGIGVMIDVVDTVASIRQVRAGNFSTQAKILTAGGAAFFAALGAVALASEDDPAPVPDGPLHADSAQPAATG